MKVINHIYHNTVAVREISYAECFTIPRGTVCEGSDPTKVYMRIKTSQRYADVARKNPTKRATAKGVSLQDGVIILISMDTEVLPVKVIATVED